MSDVTFNAVLVLQQFVFGIALWMRYAPNIAEIAGSALGLVSRMWRIVTVIGMVASGAVCAYAMPCWMLAVWALVTVVATPFVAVMVEDKLNVVAHRNNMTVALLKDLVKSEIQTLRNKPRNEA
jgi:hypothetical protein